MNQPLAPINESDRGAPPAHDYADGGYSLRALERLLSDSEDQPRWRDTADLCCIYYDVGGVYTPEQLKKFQDARLDARTINLVGRVINGVLGQEAKSRRDPKLEADDADGADVCDVLNVKLKEAQRESLADMAISNGYASQVKAGIGWVEVSRCSDPQLYPYRVQEVHRNEIWWDWRAKTIDLRDARWICRRQWKDVDEVIATFPEHRQAILESVNNWSNWLLDDTTDERLPFSRQPGLTQFYNLDRSFRVARGDWIDGGRQRIRLYEVWYRVPTMIVCMRVGPRWVPVDKDNPLHREAIARKLVKLEKRPGSQIRKAIFAGPYRLVDEATTKTRFPYIPFFAFRADSDYTPYGLIHGMIAPQDEYNERRMRIQWMLKAQQLMIDSDALDAEYNDIDDIVGTMMRPDMVAVLNPTRQNRQNAMTFRNDVTLQKEQFELMQDSKQLIQDVPGVYSSQLGDAPTGVTANSAMVTLVEQGLVAMGELNDNYAHARRMVYDELVDLIAEDHAEENLRVAIGAGKGRRVVVLNAWDPEAKRRVNDVKNAKVTTGLAEVPATPAYMMQMSQMMGDMLRALANRPEASLILPAWVESTSAFGPNRQQLADDMRRMSGMPQAGDRASQEQWQQQQEQAAAKRNALQEQALQAELAEKAGSAALAHAKVDLTQAQVGKTLAEAEALATRPEEDALISEALMEALGRGGQAPAPQAQQPQEEAVPA